MTGEPAEAVLLLVHRFDAPVEAVFDAWMRRDEWQAWLGPQGVHCEVSQLEAKVDGRYRLTMHLPSGDTIPVAGIFKTIERPHRLQFTWGLDGDLARQSLISLTFRSLGPRATELTLRQEGLGSKANREAHGNAWRSAFQKLAARLAEPRHASSHRRTAP